VEALVAEGAPLFLNFANGLRVCVVRGLR